MTDQEAKRFVPPPGVEFGDIEYVTVAPGHTFSQVLIIADESTLQGAVLLEIILSHCMSSYTKNSLVAVCPDASVTVTEYVPGHTLNMLFVVDPFDHE